MSQEMNKALLRQLWAGFNNRNLDVFIDLAAQDYNDHAIPSELPSNREGWKMLSAGYIAAFPDVHVHELDLIANDDYVIGRFRLTGTHQGELMGIPATNKTIDVTGILIVRIENGKFTERWEEFNNIALMQQLGVVPTSQEMLDATVLID